MPAPRRDRGFTLVESIIVTGLIGLVATVIAAAFVTIVRVAPPTQFRVDDARSTRSLQLWLTRDVASTPPEEPVSPGNAGFWFAGPSPNDCGAAGTFVLYMNWVDAETNERFHANYFIEGSGPSGPVVRTVCSSSGPGSTSVVLTSEVSRSLCSSEAFFADHKHADLDGDTIDDEVQSVELCLVATETDTGLNAGGGDSQEIRLSVSSRNYVEYLP